MDEEKFVLADEHGSKNFFIFPTIFLFSKISDLDFWSEISKYFVMFDFIVSLQTVLYS